MIQRMQDLDLNGKTLLIRQDLNVPIKDGKVSNDARIRASLPTIEMALAAGANVRLMSHLGRPVEGESSSEFSLAPVAERLSDLLGRPVSLQTDWLQGIPESAGDLVLCENVRFNVGEKANDQSLAKQMAGLCDIFVMDAFGTAHRAHASTCGVAEFAKQACAGPLLSRELAALAQALDNPARPIVAIVGGSKVSTKLTVLDALSEKVDQLIVGGGIANTFIAAQGHAVGQSLYEPDLIAHANRLSAEASANGAEIPMPSDVVCGKAFSASTPAQSLAVDAVGDDDLIFDIGEQTAVHYARVVKEAGTIIWNGPVGVFEFEQFAGGTRSLAKAIAESEAFSIAGGGDTVAAIDQFGVADEISYISTGGGAFLEFIEGKTLPAVVVLQDKQKG